MNTSGFDPFNKRLARDIRNSLGKQFIKAISENDSSFFLVKADEYMARELTQGCREYIRSRIASYEKVMSLFESEDIEDELQQAFILWEYGLYFEMHELLEKLWMNEVGNEKHALQALIRAAGMKMHAENNNNGAALSMGEKSLEGLALYGKNLKEHDKLETIKAGIRSELAQIGAAR